MKNEKIKKMITVGYKIALKALPFCAMAMVVINSNTTSCWLNGQPSPPKTIKKYRKF